MMRIRYYRAAIGYRLLGTALTIAAAQPFAFAKDVTADQREIPGFSFAGAATATGTASLSSSATMSFSVPDTTLDDQEYEGRLERFGGIKIIRTRFDRG